MKKILLGTTTLIGAAALFAGAAVAGETPKVTIGGVSDFQVGYVNEDRSGGTGTTDAGFRSGAFKTETDLSVKVDAKTDAGLGYGGEIVLDVSNTDDNAAGTTNGQATDQIGKSYVYLDGAWGRLEGGSNYGAASTLKVDASKIARATGGIDGDFNYFMSATSGALIATPDLLLDYGVTQYGDESHEAINKATYYTPRFAGFQAGVSYLFDSTPTDRGTGISRADATTGEAENIFVGGINYDNKFGDVSFAAAATGEYGSAENADTEDLRSWNVGAKVGYMGFSLAGSYGSWGDSLKASSVASDEDSNYYTVGAAYETGPFGVSVTYLNSQLDVGATDNEFSNISVGVDYKLAPGLTPYAEVSFAESDIGVGTANDNDATVFIAGTQLAF